MSSSLPLLIFVCASWSLGFGLWRFIAPMDTLWKNNERLLLARGLVPQRSAGWESRARFPGWFGIAGGVILFVMFFRLMRIMSGVSDKSSGVVIEGRELTQGEWDGCGHNLSACASQYAPRK